MTGGRRVLTCKLCGQDVPTEPVGTSFVRLLPHKDARGKRCEWSNDVARRPTAAERVQRP